MLKRMCNLHDGPLFVVYKEVERRNRVISSTFLSAGVGLFANNEKYINAQMCGRLGMHVNF